MYSEFSGRSSVTGYSAGSARRAAGVKLGYGIIEPLCALADAFIILFASIVSGLGYQFLLTTAVGNIDTYAGIGVVTGIAYLITAQHLQLYRIQELLRRNGDYHRVLAGWMLAILFLSVVLFVFKVGSFVSRGSIAFLVGVGGLCLVVWRMILKRRLRTAFAEGWIHGRRAIVLGDATELAPFGKRDLLIEFGVDEVERCMLPWHDGARAAQTVHAVQRAMQRARDSFAEEIILALPWRDASRLEVVRKQLRHSPLPVRLLPDRCASAVLAADATWPQRSLLIVLQRAPLSALERGAKRALDMTVAGGALILLAPLMGVAAVAVKLESTGPVIFKQRRRGFDRREFVIYKFRTMKVLEDGPSIVQAKRGDARTTRIGRVLRQTSIDELPQLINVIKGDMSIVGPRPHAVAHDIEYGEVIVNYAIRHHVRPGITGWAQVHGYRGETPYTEQMAKRIELDLWYINNWTILLDMQILIRTCVEVVRPRNAF